jgi:hypothetical protein
MTVGKNSCIAPGVAVGRGAGASVSGKSVKVSMGIFVVLSGVITETFVGEEVVVRDGNMSCDVDV